MGLITWLILLPLVTALAVALAPDRPAARDGAPVCRWIALAGTGMHLLLTLLVSARFADAVWTGAVLDGAGGMKLALVERVPWFERFGIDYFVGLDGMSLAMVILTSIVIFTGVLASWGVTERAKEFFVLLLVLVTGVFGVFVSFDLFLFFVFYEVAVLPMYLLIGVWGTGSKEYSAMKLTLMLMMGSALILVGILALHHGAGGRTFDLLKLADHPYPPAFQRWVFPVVFVGFGVIGALYPLHTWSPDGHASAPTAVSMLHAGVLMKLGGYGALRIGVYLLPEGAKEWALCFMGLATINILYGAYGAIMQRDLKYFVAYSSVSHCGMVLFGVATLGLIGMKGAVLQMFSHGIMTGLFFGLIGMVYGRTHTRIMPEMGGLARTLPWFAAAFFIAGLASLGLPGLSGFVAEAHIFLGGFLTDPSLDARTSALVRALTVIATLSLVVTAVFVLRGLALVFMGPVRDPRFEALPPATWSERLSTGVLAGTLVVVGVFPAPLIGLVEPSLAPLVRRLAGGG
jgi:NADH-quinone oxidoreductase subunit M